MNSTLTNVKSALISALLTAVLSFAVYVLGVGDVFKLDVHAAVNVVALSALTALVSFIKSSFTTSAGNFAGLVNIK